MSGGDARQRRYRERAEAGGLVEVSVWVPADRADELRAYAATLRGGREPRSARRAPVDPAQGDLLPDLPPAPPVPRPRPRRR